MVYGIEYSTKSDVHWDNLSSSHISGFWMEQLEQLEFELVVPLVLHSHIKQLQSESADAALELAHFASVSSGIVNIGKTYLY